MDIYLVRHGQTDGNVAKRHQHPDIELNEVGKEQVKTLALVIKRLRPTHLITSTNVRAVETARAIAMATDLIPETYPAFEELHRPEYLIGERLGYIESLKYVVGWFFDVKSAVMHDGESYASFLMRLDTARRHLEALPLGSKVVIVSHAVFINFFLEHMNKKERMGLTRAFIRFFKIFHIRNTAMVHLRFNPHTTPAWHQLQP